MTFVLLLCIGRGFENGQDPRPGLWPTLEALFGAGTICAAHGQRKGEKCLTACEPIARLYSRCDGEKGIQMQGRQNGKFSWHSPVVQCIALGAVILAADLAIPLGVAHGVLYTVVVLVALRMGARRDILIVAALCTLLILMGFFFSSSGGELWKVVFNRSLSVFVVWTTTLLSLGLFSREEHVQQFSADPDAFDVVVSDVTMPNMNGLELAREPLGIRPELSIILCTGFNESSLLDGALEVGVREIVDKPVELDILATKIRRAPSEKPVALA